MHTHLIQHIASLLQTYDCVAVPGLGALIMRTEPAVIGPGGAIEPPRNTVVFCRDISHNDGLLTRAYARALGLTYRKAEHRLLCDIDDLKAQLLSPAGITLPELGRLAYDTVGQLTFEAFQLPNYLPRLQLDSVLEMVSPAYRPEPVITAPIGRHEGVNVWRRIKIAASVAVLLAIGLAVSTPIPIRHAQHASPALGQFKPRQPQPAVLPQAPAPVSEAKTADVAVTAVPEPAAAAQPVAAPEPASAPAAEAAPAPKAAPKAAAAKEDKAPSLRLNPDDSYCLVVASLPDEAGARAFIAKSGRPMMMMQQDGRYRVYALTAKDKGSLQKQAVELGLKSRYPGAWACAM